jgi:hypothetical protein
MELLDPIMCSHGPTNLRGQAPYPAACKDNMYTVRSVWTCSLSAGLAKSSHMFTLGEQQCEEQEQSDFCEGDLMHIPGSSGCVDY